MVKASDAWRERERVRQTSRTMPVWQDEPFWSEHAARCADHFVHVSGANPPLLAYTMSVEKGARDIQTQIKPGRYLTRYFNDVLTEKQIAYYAAWQANGAKPQGASAEAEIQYAIDEESIVAVYARGPRSCMDAVNFPNGAESPVRVYAAGDLAIAYIAGTPPPNRPDHNVLARCLVWPEKKVAGRVYPTEGCFSEDGFPDSATHMAARHALHATLKAAGFTFLNEGGSFNGAKLQRIETNESDRGESYVMPYLDSAYGVVDAGKYFTMQHRGYDHECSETCGYISADTQPVARCDRCDSDIFYEGDMYPVAAAFHRGRWRHQTWCHDCCDQDTFHCNGFEENVAYNVGLRRVGDATYSRPYCEENFYVSNFSGECFDPDCDPSVQVGDAIWTESEFNKHGFTCQISGSSYANSERHVEHSEIHEDSTEEEIAEWLNSKHA